MTEYRDDPDLTPEEKELTISFARDENRMHVHAEIAVAVKWLDNHPEFHETDRRESDGVVHSLTGTLPVGALQLKGNPRQSNTTGRTLGTLPDGDDDE